MADTSPLPPGPAAPDHPPGWEGLLDDDERILWQGRPSARLYLRGGRDLFESLFGLFFAGFALFWITMAASIGSPSNAPGIFRLFPLFGLPFLLVGAYMAVGKFFWRAYVRARTNYTLTSKRGFIATEILGTRRLRIHPIGPDLDLEETPAGDNLWFATERRPTRRNHRTASTSRPVGFELIPDGRRVMALARQARKDTA